MPHYLSAKLVSCCMPKLTGLLSATCSVPLKPGLVSKLRTDSTGHLNVAIRDPAGIVRNKPQFHVVVPDIDIRMVPRLFSQRRHPIHEMHCLNKVFKHPAANQLAVLQHPGLVALQKILDLDFAQTLNRNLRRVCDASLSSRTAQP